MEFRNGAFPFTGYDGTLDTFIISGAAYTGNNYGTCSAGLLGYLGGANGMSRYMISFDISSIPSGVTVKKAYLTIYGSYSNGTGTITCHALNELLIEGFACGAAGYPSWTDVSGGNYNTAACGSISFSTAYTDSKYHTFELALPVVQSWINDSSKNYGLLLKAEDETTANSINVYYDEVSLVQFRPKLTVYYSVD